MNTEIIRHKIVLRADTSKLCDLRESLTALCDQHEVPPKVTRRMVLAIDEAIANIIEHARLPENENTIELSLEVADETIEAEISDRGIPFDPGPRFSEPDRNMYPRRGFGLYLIHMIADAITYERTDDGRNILTLTMRLG